MNFRVTAKADDACQFMKRPPVEGLRRHLMLVAALAGLPVFAGGEPARADCRTQNAACIKDATSPIDSVACGSLYRTCATNQAITAQQNAKQGLANKPAAQAASPPPTSSGTARPVHK
jgi:hypothetical protein